MPIEIGDRPDEDGPENAGINKFLGFTCDGYRGRLIAVTKDKKKGIILSTTGNKNQGSECTWGVFYLVEETNEKEWPRAIRTVTRIPDGDGEEWEIL